VLFERSFSANSETRETFTILTRKDERLS